VAPRHLRKKRSSSLTNSLVIACIAVAFVAIAAALAVHVVDDGPTASRQGSQLTQAAPQQPVSQVGRLVAVTSTTVTAESLDGFARTYVITPETNAITAAGSAVGGAATSFAVDDEVSIVGVVRDGTAVATAVAHQQVSNLNGPPMDGV
jgi:predicted PurR-regulated permease PerM